MWAELHYGARSLLATKMSCWVYALVQVVVVVVVVVRVMADDSITVRNGLVVNKINDQTASRSTNRSVSTNHSSSTNRTAGHRHSQRQSV